MTKVAQIADLSGHTPHHPEQLQRAARKRKLLLGSRPRDAAARGKPISRISSRAQWPL